MAEKDNEFFEACACITLYQVREEIDKEAGRGGASLIGYFGTRAQALAAARGKGIQGGNSPVIEVSCVKFQDGLVFELGDKIEQKYIFNADREAALAKLTPEDRRVLGLE